MLSEIIQTQRRVVKFPDMENQREIPRGWQREKRGVTVNWAELQLQRWFWDGWWGWLPNSMNVANATELIH